MKVKPEPGYQNIPVVLLYILYIAFFIGFIFSFRAVSSISIALLIITVPIYNKREHGNFFRKKIPSLLLSGCILIYLLQFTALLYTNNLNEGWHHIQLKSALLFVPFAVAGSDFLNEKRLNRLLTVYCILLLVASVYCLGSAIARYNHSHELTTFFYHELVSPFSKHSIYFSILIFVALVFLLESIRKKFIVMSPTFHYSMIAFFSFFLLLLSSRLVLSFGAFYIIYFILFFFKKSKQRIILLSCLAIAGSGIMITKNPVSRRFHDLVVDDYSILKQDRYDPGTYFNGIQFRLLQWKIVPEILTENNSWLLGVSPGDAQAFLNNKYVEKNMYTGESQRGDRGYLGYNTHNQFLQTLLQNGLLGLCVFILIFFAFIRMLWQKKERMFSFVTILLLLYSFLESLFETQYGLLLFLFFPLFFYTTSHKQNIPVD